MMMRNTIYICLLMMLVTACSKVNPGDCFKSNGELTTESRETQAFRYLHLYDNVDVFLVYSSSYSIEVRAGKNIIPGIKTRIEDSTLIIQNENTCNWVRNYEQPIEVYIGTPTLDSIVYQASGNLESTNQFYTDSLKLDVLEGAGTINLNVEALRTSFNLHYGTVDLNVRGKSHISYVYSSGYGPANLRNLWTVFTYITNNSTNNCYVWVSYELEARIESVGDVYYWGNPSSVTRTGAGPGKLLKQ